MKKQNFEIAKDKLTERFRGIYSVLENPEPIKLSWSNWGFGTEPLSKSVKYWREREKIVCGQLG